jgi:hypothetical protein
LTLPGTLPSPKQREQHDDDNDRDKNPYGHSRFENAANDSAPAEGDAYEQKEQETKNRMDGAISPRTVRNTLNTAVMSHVCHALPPPRITSNDARPSKREATVLPSQLRRNHMSAVTRVGAERVPE